MKYKNVLIISDHEYLLSAIHKIISEKRLDKDVNFAFASSPDKGDVPLLKGGTSPLSLQNLKQIDVGKETADLIERYDLIISLHCRQIFPEKLISKIKCINVHPGFNPHNRGWYPHVFSIINKLPAGVTIHEMDKNLDHGPIIIQEEILIVPFDTSETVYKRILDLEIRLFDENIERILKSEYKTFMPSHEGNVNYKKDFDELCRIDLGKSYKGEEFMNLLRALTHGDYKNAYFVDDNNKKIFIKVILEKDN